jgi:thiosulfate/3-mercaptopyruvate sulfurtransferase
MFVSRFASAESVEPKVRSEMLVSTGWLNAHLHDADLVVLCIAEDDAFYSAGHIPGARLIRLSQIATTRAGIPNELPAVSQLQRVFQQAGIDNLSHIILYGERSGVLAARAYFTLDYLGLADHAALVDGGIEKWRAEKRPESVESPQVPASNLQVRAHPEILVDLAAMEGYSRAKPASRSGAVLMDARPEPEYTGEERSEDVTETGHIPNAVSLYWPRTLQSPDTPTLRSPEELQELFHAAGALPGKQVITYCRTGMQSSFDYFVAKYLGYSARMYDGSFYEWSLAGRPAESAVKH